MLAFNIFDSRTLIFILVSQMILETAFSFGWMLGLHGTMQTVQIKNHLFVKKLKKVNNKHFLNLKIYYLSKCVFFK